MEDQVRVLRIIEYVGPRSAVEAQLAGSLTGEKVFGHTPMRITVTTISSFPEIVNPPINLNREAK